MKTNTNLERFYREINSDPALYHKIETLTDRNNFANLVVKLGSERGYHFTISDVEGSIEANTAPGQGDYFCLPIGCWHKT